VEEGYRKKLAWTAPLRDPFVATEFYTANPARPSLNTLRTGLYTQHIFYAGKRRRFNGPAAILVRSDGSVYEEYYI
jgi:hypothetical protein